MGKAPLYREKTIVTTHTLRVERGPNPNFEPLPEYIRKGLTAPRERHPYNDPALKKIFQREGLLRFKGETDSAYLLRVWRFFQRYWTGGGTWNGYPVTPNLGPNVRGWEERSGHVRALVFLDKVGWIRIDDDKGLENPFGAYTFGHEWIAKYIQYLDDESPTYPKPKRPPTARMKDPSNLPQKYIHGSVTSRIVETPNGAAADSTKTTDGGD